MVYEDSPIVCKFAHNERTRVRIRKDVSWNGDNWLLRSRKESDFPKGALTSETILAFSSEHNLD